MIKITSRSVGRGLLSRGKLFSVKKLEGPTMSYLLIFFFLFFFF